jgi:pyrroloquinoline quinone biosynthesis protein B
MKVLFLGSAGGGGLPQWNCNCPYCDMARRGSIPKREESSLAVSTDGNNWVLIDAPPATGTLIAKHNLLGPTVIRGTSLRSIIVTHTDINHMLGIFAFRGPTTHMYPYITLYSTEVSAKLIKDYFKAYSIIKVRWYKLKLNSWNSIEDVSGNILDLQVFPLPVPGKPPTYHWYEEEGMSIALLIRSGNGKSILYAPVIRTITEELKKLMDECNCIVFDGTFWDEEELIKYDSKGKRAKEIGHIPVKESLDILINCKAKYKVYTHINNTNPLNYPASSEYMHVLRAGILVAYDGMELSL